MKKILMITALCAVIMTSVGCQNNDIEQEVNNPGVNVEQPVEDNKEPETPVEDNKEPETPVEDNKEPETPVEDNKEPETPVEDNKEPETPVEDNKEPETPVEDNKEPETPVEGEDVEEGPSQAYLDLEKIINKMNEDSKVEVRALFNTEITSETCPTFLGLTEEDFNNNVEIAIASESMVMPSNHSFCLLKLKDGADVAALKKTVFDNCDPRKWICMGAEYVLVSGKDNYLMLVMSSKENCQNLLKAFESNIGVDSSVLERVEEEW